MNRRDTGKAPGKEMEVRKMKNLYAYIQEEDAIGVVEIILILVKKYFISYSL